MANIFHGAATLFSYIEIQNMFQFVLGPVEQLPQISQDTKHLESPNRLSCLD